ncbi:hypothetical protein D3C84_677350 [compost metagenome]
MHEGVALLLDQLEAVGQRLGEGIAVQHHPRAAGTHRLHLDVRGAAWHDDDRLDAELLRAQRQALGVVAGGGGDYPARLLFLAELGDLVVGAADLEGEHRLQVLALEQDLVVQPFGEAARRLQGSFHRHVVDGRSEDLLDVLFEHRRGRRRNGQNGPSLLLRPMVGQPPGRWAPAWRYNARRFFPPCGSRHESGSAQAGGGPGRRRPHPPAPRVAQHHRCRHRLHRQLLHRRAGQDPPGLRWRGGQLRGHRRAAEEPRHPGVRPQQRCRTGVLRRRRRRDQ